MTVTHYRSASKGPTPIASMHDAHLDNAIQVLARKRSYSPDDAAELEALNVEQVRRSSRGRSA